MQVASSGHDGIQELVSTFLPSLLVSKKHARLIHPTIGLLTFCYCRVFFDQAVQPGVRIETLLKVLKYLDKERKELEEKLGVNTVTDSAETYLNKMKGPVTRVEASMMAKVTITPR